MTLQLIKKKTIASLLYVIFSFDNKRVACFISVNVPPGGGEAYWYYESKKLCVSCISSCLSLSFVSACPCVSLTCLM